MARILVAEDDPKQADVLRRYLESEGHQVVLAPDGRTALDEARRRTPDLVVLDVMMPGMDGHDVCRILRYETDIPVIFVTALSTENDLLLGLDLGADDYIRKPFSPRELVARVRVVLRRVGADGTGADDVTTHGGLVIDRRRARVQVGGETVELTPKEYGLLVALANDPGRAFSRRQLIEAAFGFEADLLDRTVDVHIANLRRKLEHEPTKPEHVITVKGIGYAFADGS
ncbi:MAG: response regulator transcription factor [Acidimicrobiia bacterium]|nr:response regulator transcription factor [Acidimicrobiia bacterium]